MERWAGKVAVVTGASAGIGASVAKLLVQKGLKVVGLARRVDKIEDLAKSLSGPGKLYPFQCDVSKEEDIIKAFKWITENVGLVHILVNNAGLMKISTLMAGSTEDWKTTIDVNVLGLCIATREAIKIMKENNIAGHIVNINSVAGHCILDMDFPFNVYPATKYAVTALTETLRLELKYSKLGIKTTSVSPGYVKTEFEEAFPEQMKEFVKQLKGLTADQVADAVVYALGTPPEVQIQEITLTALGF